jgi:hypothetical protein
MKFCPYEVTQTLETAYSAAGDVVDLGFLGGDCLSATIAATVDTPSAKTFDSGESEVTTLTFDTKANTDPGDYVVVYDTDGNGWAVYADVSGSDPEPTGAVWDSIDAARKTSADISAATDAASVAAIFETAFDGLTDFPFTTDDTAANGTMLVTCNTRGPTTDADTFNEDDSGAGSIVAVETNAGVASEVNITDNEVTIPTHGFSTGLKGRLTTTGTLPAGVTTGVDYFIIVVDANTVQFASSLDNALDGTAIDLTNQGSDGAVNTFTATSIAGCNVKFQQSNDNENWADATSATNITATAVVSLEKDRPAFRYYRIYLTITAGHVSLSSAVLAKGDK